MRKYVLILLLFTVYVKLACAQVPKTLSFQGYLVDKTSGDPLNGNFDMRFSIWDAATGGSELWFDDYAAVAVSKGLYNVILGDKKAINLPFDKVYYLLVKVGLENLDPRITITSSAYSISSINASNITSGTLNGSLVGSGINAANITTGTIDNALLDIDLQDLADGSLSGSKVGSGINAANITTNSLAVANGGTGAATAATARTNLGLAVGTNVQAWDADLDDLADGSLTGSKVGTGINAANVTTGSLAIANGGTGATTAANARTNLGLGSISTLNAITTTEITDGTITNADISANAAIADTKLATISTAGKISGSSITSGTIAGSTVINTSGNITTGGVLVVGNPSVSSFSLDVKSSANATTAVVRIDKTSASGSSLVDFYRGGFIVGNITESAGNVSYNSFTGSHIGLANEEMEVGTIVTLNGNLQHIQSNHSSEPIYPIVISHTANDPRILGAYLHPLDNVGFQSNIGGQLQAIMAVGNGTMWVVDNGEDIEAGDYLISSSVKGHAMKDIGEFDMAYIIGRVAEPVKWSEVINYINGVRHKRINVFFENFKIDHRSEKNVKNLEGLKQRITELEVQIERLEKTILSFSYSKTIDQ